MSLLVWKRHFYFTRRKVNYNPVQHMKKLILTPTQESSQQELKTNEKNCLSMIDDNNKETDEALPEIIAAMEALDKALNTIPIIIKYREKEKEKQYNEAKQIIDNLPKKLKGNIYDSLEKANNIFVSLGEFKDSKKNAEFCAEKLNKLKNRIQLRNFGFITLSALLFSGIIYWCIHVSV